MTKEDGAWALRKLYKIFKDQEELTKDKHMGRKEYVVWSKAAWEVEYYMRKVGVDFEDLH